MKNLWKNGRLVSYGFVIALMICFATAAGVNGVFNSVNSTQGYQVAGAAGSTGQALCSDGTRFNTPCASGGGTITSIATTAPLTGGGSSGAVTIGSTNYGSGSGLVRANALGTAGNCMVWAAAGAGDEGSPCAPPFTGTSGYQQLSSGLVLEWGNSSAIADGSPGSNVCFPHAFPTGVFTVTAIGDFGSGGSRIISVRGLSPDSGASPFPCANGGFWAWSDGSGEGARWIAIGY